MADPVYADVVLDYFDSGAGPIPGPYGGTNPGAYPVPVSTSVVLGPDGSPVDFLSLPTGSFVIVGFTSATILDGPGNDIFIQEVGAGGEEAQVFVSANGTDFVLLGIANDATNTSFDLASIGFTQPVTAVKIVGLDNGGDSPGFDVVNVQGLPGSFNLAPVANPDKAETERNTAVVIPVLANDTDPDGDAFGLDAVGQPSNGTATIEGNGIRYTPATGFTGTDSFTYVVKDARGATATGTVTVQVGAPDIVATIAAGSTTWVAGDFVPITVTVTNASDVEIKDAFGVEIVLSTDAVIDDGDAILNFESIAGLAARGSDLATYDLRVDGLFENGFMPGTYYLGVFADSFEEIDEDNEVNNRDLLQVTLASDEPDLVVTSFSLGDTDWEAGETISFSGTVANVGGGDIESFFGDFAVSIYLSPDMAIDLGDLLLMEAFVADLDAGASAGFSGSFAVDSIYPGAIGGGTYFVGAYADDYFEVDESNEGNNVSVPVEVTIGKPDLVFEGFAVDDTDWMVGDTITVSGRIRNIGEVEIKGGEDRFLWGVALGTSAAFADATEDRAIPPGGSIDVAQSFVFTDALARQFPVGSYALVGIVDTGGAIDEENEANNTSEPRAITISETELDYTIANFSISDTTPGVDQPVTFTFDIDNLGPGDGEDRFFVQIFASRDPTVTADDRLITLQLFPDGLPASPGPQRVTVTAPFDVGPGSYFVAAVVDAEDEIDETNEANNLSNIVQVTVPPTIFLDFDNAIPRSFAARVNPFTGTTDYTVSAGTSPTSVFSVAQQTQLVGLVQDIFDRSNVDVFVTRMEPSAGDYHSARFSPPTGALLGMAYEGIDQFNKGDNNIVAVFRDGASMGGAAGQRSAALVAEDIAHEVAHSMGLRHINPVFGASTEIMDYQDSPAGRFWNGAASIYEPPFDSNTTPTAATHNPVYHLRRYLNDQTEAALQAAGIQPGTWDVPSIFQRIWSAIDFGILSVDIEELFLARFDGSVDPRDQSIEREAPLLTLLGEGISEGDRVSFSLPEGTAFMLLGATEPGGELDLQLSFRLDGGRSAELAAAEGLELVADVLMFTAPDAPPVTVGTAELGELLAEDVSPDPAPPRAGTPGDDRLDNRFGDEEVDGLGGRDTFVYLYTRDAVEERVAGDGTVEIRSIEGELDRLASIERVELLDGLYLYDLPGEDVPFSYRLYSAAFARTPDEPGLRFWNDRRNDGMRDRDMSQAFVDSPEFADRFGADPTDEEYIDALYLNVLLRPADPGGEAFWLDAFASGRLDRADMLIAFSESPENMLRNEDNYDDGVWVI